MIKVGTLVIGSDTIKHYIKLYGDPISIVYTNQYIYTWENEKR